MDSPIIPFDLQRIFLGDYPPLYFAEIAFRVAVIYAYTLLLIRWIGPRSVAQLSLVELLLVIALGSAVGDAMFYDDVPLLVAMLVITLVVAINKLLDRLVVKSDRAARMIDGQPTRMVSDGAIDWQGMHHRNLGASEVKAMLRCEGITNLGQVAGAYMEASGGLSVFRATPPQPGLAIFPPPELLPPAPLTDPAAAQGGLAACAACGQVADAATVLPDGACPVCAGRVWASAVTEERPDGN